MMFSQKFKLVGKPWHRAPLLGADWSFPMDLIPGYEHLFQWPLAKSWDWTQDKYLQKPTFAGKPGPRDVNGV